MFSTTVKLGASLAVGEITMPDSDVSPEQENSTLTTILGFSTCPFPFEVGSSSLGPIGNCARNRCGGAFTSMWGTCHLSSLEVRSRVPLGDIFNEIGENGKLKMKFTSFSTPGR